MLFTSKPMSIQLRTVLTGASVDISTSSDKEICYITGQDDTFLWGLFRRKVVCCHFVGPFLDCLLPDKLGNEKSIGFNQIKNRQS